MQASEMRFLRNIKVVTMFDQVCYSAVQQSLNIYLLLFPDRKILLKWFSHECRMLQERLYKQTLLSKVNRKKPVDYYEQDELITLRMLVGTIWDFIHAKYSLCWWTKRCRGLTWSCCPRNPQRNVDKEKKKRKLSKFFIFLICNVANIKPNKKTNNNIEKVIMVKQHHPLP